MKTPMQLFYGRVLLALLGGTFCGLLYWFHWVQPLDRAIYDAFNESATLALADDVVIVAVDEESLAELGRWPWPRENHVELLRQLRKANVAGVAIDILFAEPYRDYPEVDNLLGVELRDLGTVVLPIFIGRAASAGQLREIGPIEALSSSAAALGHVHIEVDSDGVARSVYLAEGLGSPRWPHFSVALARVLGLDLEVLPGVSDEDVLADPDPRAIIRSHASLIPFMGGSGTVSHVSFADVMKGRVAPGSLQGKIIFVGATAAGHVDNITTSLGQIPGVEVNANIFHALRSGKLAESASTFSLAISAFFMVAILLFFITRLEPGRLLLSVFAIVVLLLVASYLTLEYSRIWASPAPALLTVLFAYPLWNWLRLATAMDFIQGQLLKLEHENMRGFVQEERPQRPRPGSSDPVDHILLQLDRAYREAQLNHELIRGTLEQLASGVILSELSGRILLVNEVAKELLGRPGLQGYLHEALSDVELETGFVLRELLSGLQDVEDQFHCEGVAASSQRNLLLQGGVLRLDRPLLLLVLTDVSDLKRSEKRRSDALNFLSHDLRAPLTSVLALIQSAREEDESNVRPEVLWEIEKYIEANLSYAENFIQLAKLEQAQPPRFDECDAQSLLDNAVAQLFHAAAARDITLRLSGNDEELWLNCSRDLVERVLINLLDNAIKYSDDGSEITIDLARQGDSAQFSVSDQGPGIDPADMQRIFDKFQQGANAPSGAGLGLRFVQAVANTHAGTISVSNRESGGCCFVLRLPLPQRSFH